MNREFVPGDDSEVRDMVQSMMERICNLYGQPMCFAFLYAPSNQPLRQVGHHSNLSVPHEALVFQHAIANRLHFEALQQERQ